jgi:hypothetical protein
LISEKQIQTYCIEIIAEMSGNQKQLELPLGGEPRHIEASTLGGQPWHIETSTSSNNANPPSLKDDLNFQDDELTKAAQKILPDNFKGDQPIKVVKKILKDNFKDDQPIEVAQKTLEDNLGFKDDQPAQEIFELLQHCKNGTQISESPWQTYKLQHREYDELLALLKSDESLWGYVENKIRYV